MTFFEEMVARLRVLFFGSRAVTPVQAPVRIAPAPETPLPPATAPQDTASRNSTGKTPATPGKAPSSAVNRTMELLARNPDLTAAQLASLLNVSQSYARTLLRRAKMAAPQPGTAAVVPAGPDWQATVRQLAQRLEETESTLERLRSTPATTHPAAANRRADVLKLVADGQSSQSIAAALGIPTGEVEFIVKIDRMSAARA
jgi:DNA-binding CsgD family transcriptional regulator